MGSGSGTCRSADAPFWTQPDFVRAEELERQLDLICQDVEPSAARAPVTLEGGDTHRFPDRIQEETSMADLELLPDHLRS